jgi:thiosulfate dehydrogenase [quinone] large subunit
MSDVITAAAPGGLTGTVVMDAGGRIRIPRGGAITLAAFRIALGLVYLWAFIAQGFGVTYSNQESAPAEASADAPADYGWNFGYDSSRGWISSGFQHSPTESYVENNTHGPLAPVVQNLPTGFIDFIWIFALAGLGIGLTFGIFSNIAGWGGFVLNIFIWLSTFPPSSNPLIDGEHVAFALSILLFMWLEASNYWGFGRWWRARTPTILN